MYNPENPAPTTTASNSPLGSAPVSRPSAVMAGHAPSTVDYATSAGFSWPFGLVIPVPHCPQHHTEWPNSAPRWPLSQHPRERDQAQR